MKVHGYSSILLLISLFILLRVSDVSGQTQKKFDLGSHPNITLVDFNNRIDRAIALLQTGKLTAVSDKDHINIMMCANTILFTSIEDRNKLLRVLNDGKKKIRIYSHVSRFAGGRYAKFEELLEKVDYDINILKVYPDWSPNRGMGNYFPKLKMEYKGTPNAYAIFDVAN